MNDSHNFLIAGCDPLKAVPPVRKGAVTADLSALGIIKEAAAAFLPQAIKGAVAEKTVEIRRRNILVTGKILALPMLKKLIVRLFVHTNLIKKARTFLKKRKVQAKQQKRSQSKSAFPIAQETVFKS